MFKWLLITKQGANRMIVKKIWIDFSSKNIRVFILGIIT